ncbi:LCP family protein [Amycolatopsis jiangsuensis]|uniref:LCP family protein required for cell wall assembly n=1 Tax=Amycolatopsis jiangsuensis TaxID=1181879 RepID=A0A840J8Q3_9PSEU|nr:LCP family protein [Amycolatopsis jiangsuensis]MBB4689747.1 LCP family protein required for cell wall assembly [Amycolatopsis jiangsuensis]
MRIAGKIVVSGLALVVFAGTAYGYATLQSLEDITRSNVIDSPGGATPGEQPADGAVDILMVGRDSRTDKQGNPLPADMLRELRAGDSADDLTDTLIVLRIPNGQQAVQAFSIPRDSYVPIPGGGKDKINSAFGRAKLAEAKKLRAGGESDKGRIEEGSLTAGRRATRQVVEDLTGVTIDHYAEVNLLSFYQISKAIGGVQVCLNQATHDPDSGANFVKGEQKIAGADALAFVRQRKNLPRSDLDRVRRQQVFLASLAGQVLSAGTLADPGKMGALIDAVKESVVLDQNWDLLDFVARMRGVSGGGIKFATVPVVNPDYRYNPAHPTWTAVQVDPEQVETFAAGLIGAAAPKPAAGSGKATVDVSNAGSTEGLAGRVADVLKGKGFTPGPTGNAPTRRTSLVRYPAALADEAKSIANDLGGLTTAESADVPAGHIEVVLGSVYSGPGVAAGGGAALGAAGGGAALGAAGSVAARGAARTEEPPITSAGENCVD